MICPVCEHDEVVTHWADESMPVGCERITGKPPVILKVHIPVRTCAFCEFSYLDWEAEEIKDKALREFLETEEDDDTV